MKYLFRTGTLLLLLALPVLIYLFLQAFGANQYSLPVYYEDGVDVTQECGYGQGQHKVSGLSLLSAHNGQGLPESSIIITTFLSPHKFESRQSIPELARVMNVFKEKEVKLLVITSVTDSIKINRIKYDIVSYGNDGNQWLFLCGGDSEIDRTAKCVFVLPEKNERDNLLVLVDEKKRIRGYYGFKDREEVDRLILETNILLSQ